MKVIGFDGWTIGSHHYQRLVDAFRDSGLELSLLHLGSWGNEKGRPVEEVIGALPVRDISFYAGKSFAQILAEERPECVIFLSTDAFAHRAFNRYCRQQGIPTIHLFHGLQQLMDSAPLKSNAVRRLWLMRGHVLKAIRYFWPTYARSLWETNASLAEWYRFATDVAGRPMAYRPKHASEDSKTNKACVYIDSEVSYAAVKYGYQSRNVVAVGNPDLISFGLPPSMMGYCIGQPPSDRSDVVYIDTALTDYGAVFDSKEDFVRHVVDTSRRLRDQGRRLVFKPHPSTGSDIISAIAQAEIPVSSNKEFIAYLRRSCACITEPSTAALVPALMGMPLFLAQYGNLAGQPFGELIVSYPRAKLLSDVGNFNSTLAAEQATVDPTLVSAWIAQNTGPLPADQMPVRVASIVGSIIDERRRAMAPAQ